MITDKDVKKLKEVFATKEDLEKTNRSVSTLSEDLEKTNLRVDEGFKKIDKSIAKLAENLESTNDSLHNLSKDVITILEIVGENKQEVKPKIKEHDEILENHERRLDKVEDKVFPTV